jgi:hypothetical protein
MVGGFMAGQFMVDEFMVGQFMVGQFMVGQFMVGQPETATDTREATDDNEGALVPSDQRR